MDQQLLSQLKDIHLPETPSAWPLAIGWWMLIALLILMLVGLCYFIRRHLRIRKQKKMLFTEFSMLEEKLQQSPTKTVISETNILLRRMALLFYPNTKVASLTSSDWLEFLDKSGETQEFSQGAGRILIDAPYRSEDIEKEFKADKLIALIHHWLSKNAQKSTKGQKGGGCQ